MTARCNEHTPTSTPRPAARREDRDTTTVETAAAFERHHSLHRSVRVGGIRMDIDDAPGRDEL